MGLGARAAGREEVPNLCEGVGRRPHKATPIPAADKPRRGLVPEAAYDGNCLCVLTRAGVALGRKLLASEAGRRASLTVRPTPYGDP
ncbi:hypothetical protein BQ8482_200018 [Mesorhizobium delmotii]|uniref:Uncharacterized protein n=1 Tax=Mesorhizobium delmotii TaxID=1631247 RepID=A0A2P9AKT6_9HYPH|nr:hypothetical protein BQ8482_200018 [Mesorhizobium delmotii]